ncbi:MAG: hypothetical protein EOO28_13600 [Comamonadaceae bacterium]|nr:MAG: hypothetical protein EOO28_13600 [Comamonadaceae bacterium]
MSISPFFLELRSGYQSEMDDLTFDSEGRDVLRRRLADKRMQLDFLVQMMEISPEMVAVVFHRGFTFRLPAVMDHLLSQESDELPEWDSLSDAVGLEPWAQDLAQVVLREPRGEWFLTVAAALEYMQGRPGAFKAARDGDDDEDEDGERGEREERDGDEEDDGNSELIFDENNEDSAGRARKEAAEDWLSEQGFDRKD